MYRVEDKTLEKLKERDLDISVLLQEHANRHGKLKIDHSRIIKVGKYLDKELTEIGDVPNVLNDLTDEEILMMLKRNREIFKAYQEYGEKVKEILKIKRY